MGIFEEVLNKIDGGRVLDVATHEGGFVHILKDNLQSYTQIIGIDINVQAIVKAHNSIGNKQIKFMVMNAEQLNFANNSFDTVSISASLHHLTDIRQVLTEMMRVLKPGGNFIVAEMHRDGQTEAELTTIFLHHWVASVDSALGNIHNKTLTRQDLISYVAELGMKHVDCFDQSDRTTNPLDKEMMDHLDNMIAAAIQRAEKAASYAELKRQGEILYQRLHKVGACREPILVIVAKK